jgi:hypothetical protein
MKPTLTFRRQRLGALIRQCGVFATACHLRNRGYTLDQTLAIISLHLGGLAK